MEILEALIDFRQKEAEAWAVGRRLKVKEIQIHPDALYKIIRSNSTLWDGETLMGYPVKLNGFLIEDFNLEVSDSWNGFDLTTPEGRRAEAIDRLMNSHPTFSPTYLVYIDEAPFSPMSWDVEAEMPCIVKTEMVTATRHDGTWFIH